MMPSLRRCTAALLLALAGGATALPTAALAQVANEGDAYSTTRGPQEAKAEADDPLAHERELFKRPRILRGNIAFWRKVFAEYSRHQSVIHDIRRPERVYQVIDFRESVASAGNRIGSLKNSEEEAAKIRIGAMLRDTAALLSTPEQMTGDQQRLAALFADEPDALTNADQFIRAQRGLREQTREAMKISGEYLPEMERIFEQRGLPKLLTRLPFVESSFNVDAYSKVAAAGLWQFMPSSARMYMRFNTVADDRKDPWRSTRAAADHLADDYKVLRDWPLAVTAYNYGRGGLVKALREVGGNGLDDLLARYSNPRFGFASRNFYSEFIAATDVERDWREHFDGVQRGQAVRFDEVRLPRYTPWRTLVRLSNMDETAFRKLNPAYRDPVTGGKLHVPAGDTVRVPAGEGAAFESALAALGPGQSFGGQRAQFFTVQVRKGDTLSGIARRYGVSEATIKRNNGLRKGRVRPGQRLRLPNLGDVDTEALQAAADAQADAPAAVEVATAAVAEDDIAEPGPRASSRKASGRETAATKARNARDDGDEADATSDDAPRTLTRAERRKVAALKTTVEQSCKKLKGRKKTACETERSNAKRQLAKMEGDAASVSKRAAGKSNRDTAEKKRTQLTRANDEADDALVSDRKGSKSKAKGKVEKTRATAARTHSVKPGQNLSTIAKRYGTTAKAIAQLNGLGNGASLKPGMKLKVPAA